MPEPLDPRTLVAVRETDHHWDDFDVGILRRIDWKFVVVTWAIATVFAIVLSGAAIVALTAVVGDLSNQTGTRGAMIPVLTAFGSFLAFVLVVSSRANHIRYESFFTCLAIAGVHLVVFSALTLANLAFSWFNLPDLTAIFPGSGTTSAGLGFFTVNHSIVGVLLACFIAAGLIEADEDKHDVVSIVPGHEEHEVET